MKTVSYLRFTLLAVTAFLTACAPIDDDVDDKLALNPTLEPAAGSGWYEPPRGHNGLKPSEFWSQTAQNAYRDIKNQPLTSGTIWIDGVQLPVLNAPDGTPFRTLLTTYPKAATDLIECALDNTQVIYDSETGTEIHGWFGLAPNWDSTPISTQFDAQEWLTACMIARLNYAGLQVGIVLEGDTPAIQSDSALDLVAPFEESTVHGNMFDGLKGVSGSAPAFNAYLCRENSLAGVCSTDQGAAYARKRICDDVPVLCGLVDIGLCDPTAIPLPPIPPAILAPPACVANGSQHWKCTDGTAGSVHKFRTIGVQLEVPVVKNSCY